MYGRVK